ncbi:MAG: hypothetical protein AMXMBFR13_26320 [Phycisphaerae bacterium]
MLSKTAEYALRAVATIARVKEDRPILAKEIAAAGQIPNKYLSKVMRDLVHAGVLTSTRGIGGGFRLRRKAESIKLVDIIRPFDDVQAARRCPFGNAKCSDENPCSMHEQWRPVAEAFRNLMERTSLAEIIAKETPMRTERLKGSDRKARAV